MRWCSGWRDYRLFGFFWSHFFFYVLSCLVLLVLRYVLSHQILMSLCQQRTKLFKLMPIVYTKNKRKYMQGRICHLVQLIFLLYPYPLHPSTPPTPNKRKRNTYFHKFVRVQGGKKYGKELENVRKQILAIP